MLSRFIIALTCLASFQSYAVIPEISVPLATLIQKTQEEIRAQEKKRLDDSKASNNCGYFPGSEIKYENKDSSIYYHVPTHHMDF